MACEGFPRGQLGLSRSGDRLAVLWCLLLLLAAVSGQTKECPEPELVANGVMQPIKRRYTEGSVLHVQCEPGYTRQGPSVLWCTQQGTWSHALPECIEINECQSDPCHNRATCLDGPGHFTCKCTADFTGVLCEKARCPSGLEAQCGPKYSLLVRLKVNDTISMDAYWHVTDDGYGWVVIQQHVGRDVDFNQTWQRYRDGFGYLSQQNSFFLGLKNIHLLYQENYRIMRIEVGDWDGKVYTAEYQDWGVEGERAHFKLHARGFSGDAGSYDSLSGSRNQPFSTYDQDNDLDTEKNCAASHGGGWWFAGSPCTTANLNGKYYTYLQANHTAHRDGLFFFYWKGFHYSARYTRMLYRPL